MRNFQLIDANFQDACPQLENTQHISIDYDTGNVYSVNNKGIAVYDPRAREFVHDVSLEEAGYLPPDGSGVVVGLQHLPDQMSACVATSSGDVILWNSTTNELECVGTVDSGLTGMAWSPDQELVVLATGQSTLIAMTREFDPITEVPMLPEEFGEAEFITVGWGKKETQFHGSEGKEAAKRKQEVTKPAFPWDDHGVRLNWRGDGQFFVVSTVSPHTGAREVRVWTRDIVLHSTSENVDGLEQSLCWKPSGSLIASSQRRPNKHDIVFFERNGLRHGEFTLPFGVNDVKVCEVLWNIDSSVLMVWCEDKLGEGAEEQVNPKSYVQLWIVNNYHWYLKQSINFGAEPKERVTAVAWDPEVASRLHVVCCGGNYLQYTFSWTTSRSYGKTVDDFANVAVIDGVKLLMTPFRKMVVPPPMCAYHLELPVPASDIAFGPQSQANAFAVLLNDGRIALFRYTNDDNSKSDDRVKPSAGKNFLQMCATPRAAGIFSFPAVPGGNVPLCMFHLTWYQDNKLMFCSQNNGHSTVSWVELKNDTCSVTGFTPVPGSIMAVAANQETGRVLVQLTDRTLLVYDENADLFVPFCDKDDREIMFPLSCAQMAFCNFGGEEVVLGLTDRFRFYVNDIELASNCTSFALHDEFLILTTHSHTCHCIKRNTPLKSLSSLSEGKAHPFDETIRRVERGSRIVHAVPEDTKLILQMPRGNLETIHPRALVLSAVRKRLDRIQFGEAFTLMKKHRINMNLIFDHNPETFMKHVETFVRQVDSLDHINLFLTDLQEEDVTKTMYTAAYDNTADSMTSAANGRKDSKVDLVCDAVREAVEKVDADKYLLSILTAYVKKTTPELDTALNRIKSLKEAGDNRGQHVSEEALKYLLFLVDVNELYDHALGTYDFDLVLMVAEKSQKDPKEYLPFLNQLRTLEENYQRYTIDKHLKRHSRALEHIAKCGKEHFGECLTLVKEHQLYPDALKLFPREGQHYKAIAVAYGQYLSEKSQPGEAGLVYDKAGEWELALASFTQARTWRQALICAHKLKYTPDKVSEFAASMAAKLVEDRRHVEAACLLEQYAGNIEEAIMTLINGSCWDESLRLMYKHERTDFIESDLTAALVDSYNNHLANIDTLRSDFERYRTRLAVVRQEKERVRLEILEGGGDNNMADADLFSDTSSATGESIQSSRYSGASGRTTSSRRSGRSRRKAERKLWSLKEGSRHEDLALVEALYQLCQRANNMKEDIQSLLRMLFLFFFEDKASDLQAKLDELLALITRHTPEIWNSENEGMASTSQPTLGPDATTNSIIAAMQQGRSQRPEVQLEPHLRIPPPMSKDSTWQLRSLSTDKR